MEEGQCLPEKLAGGGLVRGNNDVTIEENIDNKISTLKAEIARLEASKATLSPLLGMKIRDIRDAMNW